MSIESIEEKQTSEKGRSESLFKINYFIFMSKNMNEMVAQLNTTIKKRTTPSACIDRFCELMEEIENEELKRVLISDFNKFISELKHLFDAVDQVTEKRFKARMLKDEFIDAKRFFKASKKQMNKVKTAIYADPNVDEETGETTYDVSTESRRVLLLIDYYPAIIKALIQTKRRAVGLDGNSKHFSQEESEAVYK